MTAPMPEPVLFEVMPTPIPNSTLPFLIRLPLATGELVLTAREGLLPHRADHWPQEPEIVERVPIRSCQRRGVAIDLVLDRPRENRSQLVFTRIQGGREGISGSPRARPAKPGPGSAFPAAAPPSSLSSRSSSAPASATPTSSLQQADTERRALPAGDYGIAHDDQIVAVVERKTVDDLVR